jgi:isopentenyl-diphosphate delta-isomerase
LNIPDEMDTGNNHVGVRNAAVRKLAHELNITGLDPNQLQLAGRQVLKFFNVYLNIFRFLYKADSDDKWMEHELDYVILVRNFDLPINANPEEVDDVKYVNRDDLANMYESKGFKFSPWFDLLYRSKWLGEWWKKLDSDIVYDQKIYKLN